MKNKGLMIVLALVSLVIVVSSFLVIPPFTIVVVEVEGIPGTFLVESLASGVRNKNLLFVSRAKLKKSFEALPYVDEVSFRFSDGCLLISGKEKDNGVIVSDGASSFFFSEEYDELDGRDVPSLKDSFSLVRISPDFMVFCRNYGFPASFSKMVGVLGASKSSSALITIADYDNNKSNIHNGTLRVRLDDLESILSVDDIRDDLMFSEAIEIIRNEYYSSKNRLVDDRFEYELSNGQLIRKKR